MRLHRCPDCGVEATKDWLLIHMCDNPNPMERVMATKEEKARAIADVKWAMEAATALFDEQGVNTKALDWGDLAPHAAHLLSRLPAPEPISGVRVEGMTLDDSRRQMGVGGREE